MIYATLNDQSRNRGGIDCPKDTRMGFRGLNVFGELRDELLNRELFLSVPAARYVLDEWRVEYNHRRPHSGLGWQTPAAFAAKLVDRQAGVFPTASRVEFPFGATPLPPTQHAN